MDVKPSLILPVTQSVSNYVALCQGVFPIQSILHVTQVPVGALAWHKKRQLPLNHLPGAHALMATLTAPNSISPLSAVFWRTYVIRFLFSTPILCMVSALAKPHRLLALANRHLAPLWRHTEKSQGSPRGSVGCTLWYQITFFFFIRKTEYSTLHNNSSQGFNFVLFSKPGPMSFLNSWCGYRETSFLQRAVLLAGRRQSLHTWTFSNCLFIVFWGMA